MPDTLLEVSGVRKTFRVARNRLTALDGVDLRIGRGETVGLVGESGCGKSTLARVLMLLERPDEGTVSFAGSTRSPCAARNCWPGVAACRWSSRTRSPR